MQHATQELSALRHMLARTNPLARSLFTLLLALTFSLSPYSPALAGDTLGDFEDGLDSADGGRPGFETPNDPGDGVLALFALPVLIVRSAFETREHYAKRNKGEPAAALVRLESTYQRLGDDDVDGYTLRGELIWAFIGIGGEFIGYREGTPKQTFDFTTVEALFRLTTNDQIRFTLAAGTRVLEGKREKTAGQAGFSFGLYPVKWAGLEVDLRWAGLDGATLGDYRGAILLRPPAFPITALRAGYRNIEVGGESLHGGEIGLVLTW
jgi:hypothetical protein